MGSLLVEIDEHRFDHAGPKNLFFITQIANKIMYKLYKEITIH